MTILQQDLEELLLLINMNKQYLSTLFLRLGLAFVFLYAGIAAFITPNNWVGFIPNIGNFITKAIILQIHVAVNVLLGLWLLSNKKIFYASSVSSVFLFGITIFNISQFDIIFRDVAILLSALALAVLTYEK